MDILSSTAFSLTLSGNSGISPFLTMLLIGIVEKTSPNQFQMNETMERIMASWPSLCLWSILTILEYVGKCVPVLDQIMDGVEAFIVPVLSTLATTSTFGSYGSSNDNGSNANENNYNNENNENARNLSSLASITTTLQIFFQLLLIFFGILLALSLHFFKMLIRLLGEGCLTQFITVVEATTVIFSVLISIFVREFAIFCAAIMLVAAGYGGKRRWDKWEEKKEEEEEQQQQQHQHHAGRGVLDGQIIATASREVTTATDYEQMKDDGAAVELSGSAQV